MIVPSFFNGLWHLDLGFLVLFKLIFL